MRREQRERRGPVMLLQHNPHQHHHQHQQQWQARGGFPGAAYPAAPSSIAAKADDCYAAATSFFSPASSPAHMKDPLLRTKAVVRGLPPTITLQAFAAQIDSKFAGSYSWLNFRPGKITPRSQVHSRAYIDFRNPLDVIAFHEEFDGHVFVNEKGAQFKAMVEYAPCQRVPDILAKKDGREGTMLKESDYLEFLESLNKPVELLPSAEVQLERRESERLVSGSSKEAPIVTPLMEFVRQKRAAKHAQRPNKSGFRSIMGPAPSGYTLQKRGEKKSASENSKEGTVYPRRGRRRESAEKKFQREALEEAAAQKESEASAGVDGDAAETQKTSRKFVKDKEKNEAVSPGFTSSRGRPPVSPAQPGFKQSSYRDRSSRVASPNDGGSKDANGGDGRRLRNKDRPDRPVWTPRRRLDNPDPEAESAEGAPVKNSRARAARGSSAQDVNEPENELNGALENGTYRTGNRKAFKDSDVVPEAGKHLKRGAAFGNNEKQVWVAVQKTG